MPDSVIKQIVGRCEEIEQKPGSEWVKFKINVGSKWPVGVSTKVEKIIEEARAVGSETATWTFKEQESEKLNENTGKPFVNRYLDKVELGDHADNGVLASGTAAAPQRPAEGVHDPLPLGDRERSIVRQTCLKAAAELFAGQGNPEVLDPEQRDTVAEVIAAAGRFEIWVYRDIDDIPF